MGIFLLGKCLLHEGLELEQALFPRTSASGAKRCTEAGARRVAPRPSHISHIRLTQMVVDMIWFG